MTIANNMKRQISAVFVLWVVLCWNIERIEAVPRQKLVDMRTELLTISLDATMTLGDIRERLMSDDNDLPGDIVKNLPEIRNMLNVNIKNEADNAERDMSNILWTSGDKNDIVNLSPEEEEHLSQTSMFIDKYWQTFGQKSSQSSPQQHRSWTKVLDYNTLYSCYCDLIGDHNDGLSSCPLAQLFKH